LGTSLPLGLRKKLSRGAAGCSFKENICTLPKALDFTYNHDLTVDASASRRKKMHWLQMLLLGWLSLGTATVAFLFWLCKRTAATLNHAARPASFPPQRAEVGANKLSTELRSA
jgi:hypothetical protein